MRYHVSLKCGSSTKIRGLWHWVNPTFGKFDPRKCLAAWFSGYGMWGSYQPPKLDGFRSNEKNGWVFAQMAMEKTFPILGNVYPKHCHNSIPPKIWFKNEHHRTLRFCGSAVTSTTTPWRWSIWPSGGRRMRPNRSWTSSCTCCIQQISRTSIQRSCSSGWVWLSLVDLDVEVDACVQFGLRKRGQNAAHVSKWNQNLGADDVAFPAHLLWVISGIP